MKTEKIIAAGILMICSETGHILLTRRGPDCDNPNVWCAFGGTFEPKDGSPKVTAVREFWEETGCQRSEYALSNSPLYCNSNKFLDFYTYVGIAKNEFAPVQTEQENATYKWFEFSELPEDLHPGFIELVQNKTRTIKKIINDARRGILQTSK